MIKKLSLWIAAGLVTLLMVVLPLAGKAQAVSLNPFENSGLGNSSVSTCAYENLGWILCPVLVATATAGDYAFTFMTQSFTQLEIGLFNSGSGAAQAGAIVRTFANVLFVLAFLVIVYSLVTGQGIGNYNIKRLVPRFIVAVIFVQVSFFICQLMIDISNILGFGIRQFLVDNVARNIGTSAMPIASQLGERSDTLADIAAGVTSSNDVAWPLLAPLAAVVMSAAVICSILIVVLIIRKVLVTALALISPLAFVAYLMPNTSDYFSKWLKLFIHTLLLFPVISVLIGTGQIVSASILRAGANDYKVENDTITVNKKANQSATLYLVAAGAAVLPLVGTWYAFKAATNGIDAASARVSRDGFRRSSRERDEKAKKREQTAMELNKKSMMLRGINRLQQLNVAKDGESTTSIFGRFGGAYRGRGKHQMKSPEQARFDSQVQQRLGEIRQSAAMEGRSPQEVYSQALQRYQESMGELGGGSGVSINSYEGIDLKASEAYLLESLAKGSNTAALGAVATGAQAGGNGNDQKNKSGEKSADKDDKKAAGLTSLNRDGKSQGGGGGQPAPDQDLSRPPSIGATNGVPPSLTGGAVPQGGSVIVQQMASPGGANAPADAANGTGYAARRPAQDSNELQAKARAAKYIADSQQALSVDDDLLTTKPPETDSKSNTPPDSKQP